MKEFVNKDDKHILDLLNLRCQQNIQVDMRQSDWMCIVIPKAQTTNIYQSRCWGWSHENIRHYPCPCGTLSLGEEKGIKQVIT